MKIIARPAVAVNLSQVRNCRGATGTLAFALIGQLLKSIEDFLMLREAAEIPF